MLECVQTCLTNEVFVPDLTFGLSSSDYNPTEYDQLVCKELCPTSLTGTNTEMPNMVILNTY